jgi:elongation factor P
MGRGGAVMRTKLRNLKTKSIFDITFKGSDKFDEAPLSRRASSYLYPEDNNLVFMDSESFEQYTIASDVLGDAAKYLKEGATVSILFFDDEPVTVEIPTKVELLVTETDPGVKGDTAQGGSKPATLETGATVSVPLFVKVGDLIRVNTIENTYVERVKE